jgi:uncharacterized protein YndB with AHSA1/START domain
VNEEGDRVGDYHILMQLDIAADQATVRQALTTENGIQAWWTSRAALRSPAGGLDGHLATTFPDDPTPFEFEVREAPERIEWVTGGFPPWWAGTTVRFDLAENPDGDGTRLSFSHRDYAADNPVIPIVTPAWAQILLRLRGYAESGRPQPFFDF